jgi:hypothetical protein
MWHDTDIGLILLVFPFCACFFDLLQLLKGSETHKEDLRVSTEASIKSIQEAARHKQEEVIKTLLDIVSRVVIVRRNDAEAAAL